jgi:hypothetical protein
MVGCATNRRSQNRHSRMAHGGLLVSIIFALLLGASGVGMYLHDQLGERAIFLIDDFDSPIDGLLQAQSDSMRATLAGIDAP